MWPDLFFQQQAKNPYAKQFQILSYLEISVKLFTSVSPIHQHLYGFLTLNLLYLPLFTRTEVLQGRGQAAVGIQVPALLQNSILTSVQMITRKKQIRQNSLINNYITFDLP